MLLEVIQPACLWPGEMTVTYGDLPHRSCLLSRHAPASPQYSISVSSVLRVTSSSSVPSVTQESWFFPGKAGTSCKRTRKAKSHLRSESAHPVSVNTALVLEPCSHPMSEALLLPPLCSGAHHVLSSLETQSPKLTSGHSSSALVALGHSGHAQGQCLTPAVLDPS